VYVQYLKYVFRRSSACSRTNLYSLINKFVSTSKFIGFKFVFKSRTVLLKSDHSAFGEHNSEQNSTLGLFLNEMDMHCCIRAISYQG